MEELLNLLKTLTACVVALEKAYISLVDIMSNEEDLVAKYDMVGLQSVIVEKDQVVQRIQKLEEKRTASLKRICYLISYDARQTMPSITEFTLVFEAYLNNVATIIDPSTFATLSEVFERLKETSSSLRENFKKSFGPAIYRNKLIVTKCLRNFQRSIKIFEDAAGAAWLYDPKGKAQSDQQRNNTTSAFRVQA